MTFIRFRNNDDGKELVVNLADIASYRVRDGSLFVVLRGAEREELADVLSDWEVHVYEADKQAVFNALQSVTRDCLTRAVHWDEDISSGTGRKFVLNAWPAIVEPAKT